MLTKIYYQQYGLQSHLTNTHNSRKNTLPHLQNLTSIKKKNLTQTLNTKTHNPIALIYPTLTKQTIKLSTDNHKYFSMSKTY